MHMIDDSSLEAAFAASRLPGAVGLIVDRDGIRYARAFGHADAANKAPMAEDTVFQIASMTKALVTLAVLQQVEQGRLALDAPIGNVLPELATPSVLAGFDDAGQPLLREASRPLTLRHLLTHTSGLGYAFTRSELLKFYAATGQPSAGTLDAIRAPLLFDPGEAWEYGVGIDWAGLAVEAATGQRLQDYMAEHVFGPLGMRDTAFRATLPDGAARVHVRTPEDGFKVLPVYLGGGQFDAGGGGLTGTAPDYARFVQMMLNGGVLDGQRLIGPEMLAEMTRNQVGPLRAGYMGSALPQMSQPFDTFPDQHTGWTFGFLTNPEPGPNGRAAGSLNWAGIFNSYYWIDPASGLGGVFMSQLSPFGDPGALAMFGALERMAYGQT